jgi:hypothetical protein
MRHEADRFDQARPPEVSELHAATVGGHPATGAAEGNPRPGVRHLSFSMTTDLLRPVTVEAEAIGARDVQETLTRPRTVRSRLSRGLAILGATIGDDHG